MEQEENIPFKKWKRSTQLHSMGQLVLEGQFKGMYAKHILDCVELCEELSKKAKIEENQIYAVDRCVKDEVYNIYKIKINEEREALSKELGCPANLNDNEFADQPYEIQEKYKDLCHLVFERLGRWEEFRDKYFLENKEHIEVLTTKYEYVMSMVEEVEAEMAVEKMKELANPQPKLEVVK